MILLWSDDRLLRLLLCKSSGKLPLEAMDQRAVSRAAEDAADAAAGRATLS